MPQILVLFAHPAIRQSRVQRRLRDGASTVPGVKVHDLYETYPDFDVDIDAEQKLVAAHDIVIFQHPFYWYSVPPLLKQWFDLVLEHGWAYGSTGTAVAGKRAGVATSAGGSKDSYEPAGFNRFTIQEFLRPVEATIRLCRMKWLPPFLVTGSHAIDDDGIETATARYQRWLRALAEDTLDDIALAAPDADAALAAS